MDDRADPENILRFMGATSPATMPCASGHGGGERAAVAPPSASVKAVAAAAMPSKGAPRAPGEEGPAGELCPKPRKVAHFDLRALLSARHTAARQRAGGQ